VHILALDTSTSLASVAIISDEAVVTETAFACNRSLSARLVPEIDHQLNLAGLSINDIDLFAASTGPGSFTGVRCGVATIQGLALATGKPCSGFSSLTALAMNHSLASHPVCALLDARKNEVYAALFDCSATHPEPLIVDCVMSMEQFIDLIQERCREQVIFVGDGAARYRTVITSKMNGTALFTPLSGTIGRASHGALLARDSYERGITLSPEQLLPDYIRPSEAELARRSKA